MIVQDAPQTVAITGDGCLAVSGGFPYNVNISDIRTGACLAVMTGHTREVTSIAVTPDGSLALSGSADQTLRLWDLKSETCLHTMIGHPDRILKVALTSDGNLGVSLGSDNTIYLWDLKKGSCLKAMRWPDYFGVGLSIAAPGNIIVMGRQGSDVCLWHLDLNSTLSDFMDSRVVLKGHTKEILNVTATPDRRRVLSGGADKTLRLWDLSSGICLRKMSLRKKRFGWPTYLEITPDGRLALTAWSDDKIRLWDLDSGRCLKTMEWNDNEVTAMAITVDGKYAISGSWDDVLRLYELEKGPVYEERTGYLPAGYGENGIAVLSSGSLAVAGDFTKYLDVYELETTHCVVRLEGHNSPINAVASLPDGKYAVTGSLDNTVRLWDLQREKCLKVIAQDKESIEKVLLTTDGRVAISANEYHTLCIWDLATHMCIEASTEQSAILDTRSNPSLLPDARFILIRSGDFENVCLVDIASGAIVRKMEKKDDGILALSSDGRWVASTSVLENNVSLWDLRTGKEVSRISNKGVIRSGIFSADGSRLLLADGSATLQIWDLETGELESCLGLKTDVYFIALSAKRIVVGRDGFLEFLEPNYSLTTRPPLVTATRLWLFGEDHGTNCWDENITTVCYWCGSRFVISPRMIDFIRYLSDHIPSGQSPCIELPDEAWDDPRLLSECPLCHKPLKFNPFIVDNRDRY